MGSEYDRRLRIWRKRLGIWWKEKTDGCSQYFDTRPFITHTRTISDIWHKTNLFHFLWGFPIEHELNKKYFDRRAFQMVWCYLWKVWLRWIQHKDKLPIPMIPAHMWPRLLWQWGKPILMHHLWTFGGALHWILNRVAVVTCPFLEPIPAPMLISELNRDQISLMGDIICGQININMWTTSVKGKLEKMML